MKSEVLLLLEVIFWWNEETSLVKFGQDEKLEKDLVNHQNHNVDSLERRVWENENVEVKNAEEHRVDWVKVHRHNM